MESNHILKDRKVYLIHRVDNYPTIPPYDPDEKYPEYKGSISGKSNPVYAAIRNIFLMMKLDEGNIGSKEWNPLSIIINPGDTVVLKPNLVYEGSNKRKHDRDYLACLTTHPSVIRAILDYVCIALKNKGNIIIGDSPIQGANWEEIVKRNNLDIIVDNLSRRYDGIKIKLADFRDRVTKTKYHVIFKYYNKRAERLFEVNLSRDSLLCQLEKSDKMAKYGVSQYGFKEVNQLHNLKNHKYIFNYEPFHSDAFINLPKAKSHIKSGITGALKNLIGIIGKKTSIPHFRVGSSKHGGDEYPNKGRVWDLYWSLVHISWNNIDILPIQLLSEIFSRLILVYLKLIHKYEKNDLNMGGGGWYGNDTLWRSIADLNRIFFYFNRNQNKMCNEFSYKKYFVLVDGVISGQGEGPLNPDPLKSGFILAGFNPVAVDLVLSLLFGFDYYKVPMIKETFNIKKYPLALFSPDEVKIVTTNGEYDINNFPIYMKFDAVLPKGWRSIKF